MKPGDPIGPYRVVKKVGVGGMGEVYRARDTKLDRDVAVKVLASGFEGDAVRLARVEREAKAVAALSHPNILGIFDFGTHPSTGSTGSPRAGSGQAQAYAVMELLEGQTMREPDGSTIFFPATPAPGAPGYVPFAVSASGGRAARPAVSGAGALYVHDIARLEGRWLVTRQDWRTSVRALIAGATEEREFSWANNAWQPTLSHDGKTLLFNDGTEQSGLNYRVAIRPTDGSPAVTLGEGAPRGADAGRDRRRSVVSERPARRGGFRHPGSRYENYEPSCRRPAASRRTAGGGSRGCLDSRFEGAHRTDQRSPSAAGTAGPGCGHSDAVEDGRTAGPCGTP